MLKTYQSNKIVNAIELTHLSLNSEFKIGDNLKDHLYKLNTIKNETILVDIQFLIKRMNLDFSDLQGLTFKREGIPIGGYYVKYSDDYFSWSPTEPFEEGNLEIKPYFDLGVKSIQQDDYDDGIQELRLELNNGQVFNQRRKWSGSKAGGVIEAYYQLVDMRTHPDILIKLICKMSDYLDGDNFEKILYEEWKLTKK